MGKSAKKNALFQREKNSFKSKSVRIFNEQCVLRNFGDNRMLFFKCWHTFMTKDIKFLSVIFRTQKLLRGEGFGVCLGLSAIFVRNEHEMIKNNYAQKIVFHWIFCKSVAFPTDGKPRFPKGPPSSKYFQRSRLRRSWNRFPTKNLSPRRTTTNKNTPLHGRSMFILVFFSWFGHMSDFFVFQRTFSWQNYVLLAWLKEIFPFISIRAMYIGRNTIFSQSKWNLMLTCQFFGLSVWFLCWKDQFPSIAPIEPQSGTNQFSLQELRKNFHLKIHFFQKFSAENQIVKCYFSSVIFSSSAPNIFSKHKKKNIAIFI